MAPFKIHTCPGISHLPGGPYILTKVYQSMGISISNHVSVNSSVCLSYHLEIIVDDDDWIEIYLEVKRNSALFYHQIKNLVKNCLFIH